jgi:LuxR family maltose regulon positive regulatory protein
LARQRAWLKLSAGDLDGAEHLVKRLHDLLSQEKFGGTMPSVFHEAQQILQARIHLCRGQAEMALTTLDQVEPTTEAAGRFGRIIEICLLKALALQAQGNTSAALTQLGRSLELAEPERITRIYLDEGASVAALLKTLCQSQGTPSHLQRYAQGLLEALDFSSREAIQPRIPVSTSRMVEPLTRRERQVLRLMLAGLSGPEIAEELVIANSTVRSHIKSIYGKLGAHSRYEAIERAKALKLM